MLENDRMNKNQSSENIKFEPDLASTRYGWWLATAPPEARWGFAALKPTQEEARTEFQRLLALFQRLSAMPLPDRTIIAK